MKVLSTPDLRCANCAEKIHNALQKAGIEHEVDVEKKAVSVCDSDESIQQAITILDDLGYEVVGLDA